MNKEQIISKMSMIEGNIAKLECLMHNNDRQVRELEKSKVGGLLCSIVGGVLCFTCVGAIVGLPLGIFGLCMLSSNNTKITKLTY